jgi:hypothetical protein
VRFICRIIWEVTEFTGIGLGKFAPWVFGGMIGRLPHKIECPKDQNRTREGELTWTRLSSYCLSR